MKLELKNGDHVDVPAGEAKDLIRWGLAKPCDGHPKKDTASNDSNPPKPAKKVAAKKTSSAKVEETPAEEPQVEEQETPDNKENE